MRPCLLIVLSTFLAVIGLELDTIPGRNRYLSQVPAAGDLWEDPQVDLDPWEQVFPRIQVKARDKQVYLQVDLF